MSVRRRIQGWFHFHFWWSPLPEEISGAVAHGGSHLSHLSFILWAGAFLFVNLEFNLNLSQSPRVNCCWIFFLHVLNSLLGLWTGSCNELNHGLLPITQNWFCTPLCHDLCNGPLIPNAHTPISFHTIFQSCTPLA